MKTTLETPGGLAAPVPSLDAHEPPAWQRLVEPVARWADPAGGMAEGPRPDTADEEPHRRRFLHAGLRSRSAPVLFYALTVLLTLGLPLAAWGGLQLMARPLQGLQLASVLLLAAALGHRLPQMALNARIARRQREIFEAFPDALDLLVVCVEAGLSLDAALERAERDLQQRSPVLAEELALVGSELRLGSSRAQALSHLALRTGVPEIGLFVATLIQSDRFGLGVAEALRVHAQELRDRRQLRAEEEAAKMPLKLLFPLIFTLFPALMVVLLGPAIIQLMRQLMPLMTGQA